jgi:hypothetical protein
MITVKIDPVSLNAPLNEPHEGLKRYSPKNWSLCFLKIHCPGWGVTH